MELNLNDHSPDRCEALGMDCESCVARSARAIAACCASLGGDTAGSMFFHLYQSPGCSPMKALFVDSYQSAILPQAATAAA
jgi:hypothetical protein